MGEQRSEAAPLRPAGLWIGLQCLCFWFCSRACEFGSLIERKIKDKEEGEIEISGVSEERSVGGNRVGRRKGRGRQLAERTVGWATGALYCGEGFTSMVSAGSGPKT